MKSLPKDSKQMICPGCGNTHTIYPMTDGSTLEYLTCVCGWRWYPDGGWISTKDQLHESPTPDSKQEWEKSFIRILKKYGVDELVIYDCLTEISPITSSLLSLQKQQIVEKIKKITTLSINIDGFEAVLGKGDCWVSKSDVVKIVENKK